MYAATCPHCDKETVAAEFEKGKSVTCDSCGRTFLPVTLREVAAAPPVVESAGQKTNEIARTPSRHQVLACPSCQALLRLGGGDSSFGKCGSCGHVFVFQKEALSEMLLGSQDAAALPLCERFEGAATDPPTSGEVTNLRATADGEKGPKVTLSCLLVSESPRIRFPLDKPSTLIGRSHADLTLDDVDVSRRHCTLEISDGKILVRDLKSTNGTLVNGKRVDLEVLKDGDLLRLGTTELRLVVVAEGEQIKHAALLMDLGPGHPEDAKQALEAFGEFAREQLADTKVDIILSPPTGRGLAIWPFEDTISRDQRRRVVARTLASPGLLRSDLATVPLPSGQTAEPMLALLIGMAKRIRKKGQTKFEGPLMTKVAMVVKSPGRDSLFLSDKESLEILTGSRNPQTIATLLQQHSLKLKPASKEYPFIRLDSIERVKQQQGGSERRGSTLREVASSLEGELLDLLGGRAQTELEAGIAVAFASTTTKPSLFGRKKKVETIGFVETKLYAEILRGSTIHLSRNLVKLWMERLAEIGRRYPDAIRAERVKAAAEKDASAPDPVAHLLAQDDLSLLAIREAALLFPVAFSKGLVIADCDLQTLAGRAAEILPALIPQRFLAMPMPVLDRVYSLFGNLGRGIGFLDLFILVALASVTRSVGEEAMEQAANSREAISIREEFGRQMQLLQGGIQAMEKECALLRQRPPLAPGGLSVFARYRLPGYELIDPEPGSPSP